MKLSVWYNLFYPFLNFRKRQVALRATFRAWRCWAFAFRHAWTEVKYSYNCWLWLRKMNSVLSSLWRKENRITKVDDEFGQAPILPNLLLHAGLQYILSSLFYCHTVPIYSTTKPVYSVTVSVYSATNRVYSVTMLVYSTTSQVYSVKVLVYSTTLEVYSKQWLSNHCFSCKATFTERGLSEYATITL